MGEAEEQFVQIISSRHGGGHEISNSLLDRSPNGRCIQTTADGRPVYKKVTAGPDGYHQYLFYESKLDDASGRWRSGTRIDFERRKMGVVNAVGSSQFIYAHTAVARPTDMNTQLGSIWQFKIPHTASNIPLPGLRLKCTIYINHATDDLAHIE